MLKKGILLCSMFPLLFVSGCWGRTEVNDIAIVTAVAIDKMNDGKIRLDLQIAIPQMLGPSGGEGGKGSGNKPVFIVSETGDTLMEDVLKIQKKVPRKINFFHTRVIIIGESFARAGVTTALDFISRNREARLNAFILFSRGEAADFLKTSPNLERISAEEIKEDMHYSYGITSTLNDFLYMLLEEGIEPVATQVQRRNTKVESNSDGIGPSSGKKDIAIAGAAVFHKDKLIGWLNNQETIGLLWLRNELRREVLTVNIPKDKGGGKVSSYMRNSTTKIYPILKDHHLTIEVNVHLKVSIPDNTSKLDQSDPEVIKFIQEKLEEGIKAKIQQTLNKLQKQYKTDILGFGRAVQRAYPKEWEKKYKKSWDVEFPKLEVNIIPSITEIRTGYIRKPLIWEEKEFKK